VNPHSFCRTSNTVVGLVAQSIATSCPAAGPEGFLGLASFQRIGPADAVVLRTSALDAPTSLYPILGGVDQDFNSAEEAAYVGSVGIRANDNDGPNQASVPTPSATGHAVTCTTADGMAYQLGWTSRVVIPLPENDGDGFEFDPA
jgi:hypothetical protein